MYSLVSVFFIQDTEEHPVGGDLTSLVKKHSEENVPYICISGEVMPVNLDQALHSQYKPGVLGVIQQLLTKEHRTRRVHGYW